MTNKLALLGGAPTFGNKVHVGRPNIGDRARLLERVNTMLDTHWLSNGGPFVKEFEERIADTAEVKHCIAICNATVALEIVIRALELKGEVIVPSFTFVATAHALQWQEITPVFCDIDPATHNLDPKKVEQMITPRTSGILAVHLWGRPCEVSELQRIADKHNLTLEMRRQALMIGRWQENVYVKIPITNTRGDSALPLIDELSAEGVKLNITAILTPEQVRGVARAVKHDLPCVVSVFAGRVADTGVDPMPIMKESLQMLRELPNAELLWASVREVFNIFQAAQCGCHIVTVTHEILDKMVKLGGMELAELSLDTVRMFHRDAEAAGFKL